MYNGNAIYGMLGERQLRACQRKFGRARQRQLRVYVLLMPASGMSTQVWESTSATASGICSVDASFGHVNASLGEHVSDSFGYMFC